MNHTISEEHLLQLLDPDMPQCAKEIIVEEVKRSASPMQIVEPRVSTVTSDWLRGRMTLLRQLYRWMQYNGPDCLGYDEWLKHEEAYKIVEKKIELLQYEMFPDAGWSDRNMYNNTTCTTDADIALEIMIQLRSE